MARTVKVEREAGSGRNLEFVDTRSGSHMSRVEFVRAIEQGQYRDYHIRVINGVKTPVSNPDRSEGNNLG